ncbi:putative porin [Emticicia sp. TH156]|uniref:putative porin n=1 Tax=Emticicia sp. TH156 TaxID=2067454 RepID=UPI000C757A6C|nr:putative porin [Emticicia sp. TH156]PLK45174.1 hypothetical protein C0V77_08060 [Emticicia sp. TH156]
MSLKKIYSTVLLTFFYGLCHAQILDDSTRQIYGLKTTRFVLEEDILNNRKTYYNPDSTVEGFHLSFDKNLRSGWLYQDLGLIGSAIKPLYFQPAEEIGKQLGFNTYGFYAFDARKAKYYNTKSPYTNMHYTQSGGGMLYLDFTHSQNIKPRLNATFDVKRLTTSKQYGAPTTREDRLVDSWAALVSVNYESKDGRYTVMGSYNHFNHAPVEQGGIKPLVDSIGYVEVGDLGNYRSYLPRITSGVARDWRNEFHVYQQYQLSNGFQVYHTIDYQHRTDYYHDYSFKADTINRRTYYRQLLPANADALSAIKDTLALALRYRLIENKVGIKGIYRGFSYRLHLRHRLYNLRSDFNDNLNGYATFRHKYNHEIITGAWANYFFPDSLKRAYAEIEFGNVQSNLNVRIKSEYIGPRLKAGVSILSIPATILDEYLINTEGNWYRASSTALSTGSTRLLNQNSSNFYASTAVGSKRLTVSPAAYLSLVDNYLYYDKNAQVQQLSAPVYIARAGLGLEYRWKRLTIANQIYLAATDKKDIVRMPVIANNTTITHDFVYAKKLHINLGADIYYRSAYLADNYMPLNRQFYLQDAATGRKAWGYPVVDLFANLKISKVRVFLKFAHANQGFPAQGYFVGSVYPGMRRTFFLGANWPLFD